MVEPERLLRAIASLREHHRMSALLDASERDALLSLEQDLTKEVREQEIQKEAEIASAEISEERVSTFRSEVTTEWLRGFARGLTGQHGTFSPVEGLPGPGHFGFNQLAPKEWFVPTDSVMTLGIATQLADALSDRENTCWLDAIEQLQPTEFSSTDSVADAVRTYVANQTHDHSKLAIVTLDSWEILHGLLTSPGGKITADPKTRHAGTLHGIPVYSWGRSAKQACLVADFSTLIDWRHWPYPGAAREQDPGGFLEVEVRQLAREEAAEVAEKNPSLGTAEEVLRMVRILIREQFEIAPRDDASYLYATVEGQPDGTFDGEGGS